MTGLPWILRRIGCSVFCLGAAWLVFSDVVHAEPEAVLPPPVLLEIVPPGAQAGATTRVELRGPRLDGAHGLLANHPGLTFRRLPPTPPESEAKKKDNRRRSRTPPAPPNPVWEITVSKDVSTGIYELRAYGAHGISLPRAFHIGPTRIQPKKEPQKSAPVAAELNTRYTGHIERNEVEAFTVRTPKSQRLIVECYGERLDSAIDATLAVLDSQGKRIAYSMDQIGSDPILAFDAAAEEEYRVEMWDLTYQDDLPYLLAISTAPRVLCTYPPLVGATGSVVLYGWNLHGSQAVSGRDDRLEFVELSAPQPAAFSTTEFATYRHTGMITRGAGECRPTESATGAGAYPFLVSPAAGPLTQETEPNDDVGTATAVELPAVAVGRFSGRGDRDWYVFEAKKGTLLEVEVVSSRLGYRCDPVFVLGRVKLGDGESPSEVADIAHATERKSEITGDSNLRQRFLVSARDPSYVWKVDQDGRYAVQVRNRNGRSGATAAYALRIGAAQPDFELFLLSSDNQFGAAPTIRGGGAQTYDVLVERRGGLDAPIRIEVEGLGKGLTAGPLTIAPQESYGPLVIAAADDAPEWTGAIRVRGTAVTGAADGTAGGTITREAVPACTVFGMRALRHPLQYSHSRFCRSSPVAVRGGQTPFRLQLASTEVTTAPGMKIEVPVKLLRNDGFDAAVRLSYHGLREKSFPNQNGERSARLTLGKGKSEGKIEFNIVNNRAPGEYSFVVFGSAEFTYTEIQRGRPRKQKFWHSTAARPLTIKVRPPVKVFLDRAALADRLKGSQESVELVAGGEIRFPVRLDRLQGVDASVELRFEYTGNKKGLSAPVVKVPKGENQAELVLSASADTALEEVTKLQIVSRVQFRGRTFMEEIDVPFRLVRVAPRAEPNTTQ